MIAPICHFCLGMGMFKCPASNALCYNCSKFGHFSRACRQSCFVQQKRITLISRRFVLNSKVQNPIYKRQSQQLEYDLNKTQNFKLKQQSNRKQKKVKVKIIQSQYLLKENGRVYI